MGAILLAPDKFKGSLDAPGVAAALAAGIADVDTSMPVLQVPVADGGEGTVAAALASGWSPVTVDARGPTGAPLRVTYARNGASALVELAAVAGLGVLPGALAPRTATTHGLGTVVAHALDDGARDIVIGVGGSASTDGGAGLLTGLGARVLDEGGVELPPGGAALARARRLDLTGLHPGVRGARFTMACDVDNPLLGPHGAATVYGPQKGATPEQVSELDTALARWADVLVGATGRDVRDRPGSGAAGGVPLAAVAALGAQYRSGVGTVLDLLRFDDALAGAALVVTGEGRLDTQTLHGKAPAGVAAAARAPGIPVVAVAGDCALDEETLRDNGFTEVHTVLAQAADRADAFARTPELLRRIGAHLARELLWSTRPVRTELSSTGSAPTGAAPTGPPPAQQPPSPDARAEHPYAPAARAELSSNPAARQPPSPAARAELSYAPAARAELSSNPAAAQPPGPAARAGLSSRPAAAHHAKE